MANAQTIQLHLKAIGDFSDVTGDISQVQQMLGKLNLPPNLRKSFEATFANLSKETTKYQNLLNGGFKSKGDVTGLEKSGTKINNLLKTLQADMAKIDPSILERSFQVDPTKLDALKQKMTELQSQFNQRIDSSQFDGLRTKITEAASTIQGVSKSKYLETFLKSFTSGDMMGAQQALAQLDANAKKFKEGSKNEKDYSRGVDALKKALAQLQGDPALMQIVNEIHQTDQAMDQLDADELQRMVQTFNQGRQSVDGMTREIEEFTTKNRQAAQSQMSFSSQLDQLKSQVGYFFGMTNAVYLLRSALQKALTTVKELDEVMTQTAVVTDMSVGDMWSKLPEYTAQATELGVAVKDLYSATTLYYQQGLTGNKVMKVGAETMKMAAIANMDAEEATQGMTAALRGFNMEVNETNAQKINDVYSKLAAITAADTGQIQTAMTKTASIASNANMEFEKTAALLAQIIETTQEAPETAGTALKTIIARFSEVKSLREKGKNTGEDEEGESINVNNIDKALKSVGISMQGFFAGTEGLDDVLLRLAEKWDTLDFETQRYIATMAAGSRQQSRFIAMMSDYGRTTELVTAAEGSAGASQEQWAKTTESLQYKLNQLSNAWNQFVMSIANNAIIKAGVDALVGLLAAINGITEGAPPLISGLLNLTVAFVGLQVGGRIISAFFVSLTSKFASGGAAAISFRKALGQEFEGVTKLFVKAKSIWRVPVIKTDQQTAALTKLAAAEKAAAKAATEGAAASGAEVSADAAVVSASESRQAALVGVAAAYELTEGQQEQFLALTTAGVSAEAAAIIAKEGFTKATYDAMVAQAMQTGLTEAEAQAKVNATLATFDSMSAKIAENGIDSLSTIEKLKLLTAILFSTKAKKADIHASLLAAKAKAGETGATWALTIATWASALPLGVVLLIIVAIIAAVVLLIAGIVALIKHAKNSTPEAKMKKFQEAAERAAEAAQEARDALDGFLGKRKEYEDMIDGMEDITKGTQAWEQAIIDANNKLLELIQNYSFLGNYLEENENGIMVVSQEGLDLLERKLSETARRATYASAMANADVAENNYNLYANRAQQKRLFVNGTKNTEEDYLSGRQASNLLKAWENLSAEDRSRREADERSEIEKHDASQGYRVGGTSGDSRGYSAEVYDPTMSDFDLSVSKYIYSQALIDLAAEFNMTAHDLYENISKLKAYVEAYNASINTILSVIGGYLQDSPYKTGIMKGIKDSLDIDSSQKAVDEEWSRKKKEGKTKNDNLWRQGRNKTTKGLEAKINEYNEQNPNDQITITGKERKDLEAYYEKISGKEFDQEAENLKNKQVDDHLVKEIKKYESGQKIEELADQLVSAAQHSPVAGGVLSQDLDADLTGFTTDLDYVDDSGEKHKISSQAQKALQAAYDDIIAQRKDIDTVFAEAMGEEYKEGYGKQLLGSWGKAADFTSVYNQMKATGDPAIASSMVKVFKELKDQDSRLEFVNSLNKVDWSSSIHGFEALNKMLAKGTEAEKTFAASVLASDAAMYNLVSQVNEFYNLIDDETLSEMFKDGDITATEILELGDSYEELDIMMKNTGVSASTLASYYEKLQDGTLDLVTSSTSFIRVLEKLNAASGTLENSFAFIDTFEAERTETEIGSSFQEMQEAMRELYDMGAYSDAQLLDYVIAFIGEENWGDIIREKGGDMKAAMDEVMGMLPENGSNMYQSWLKFAQMNNGGMASVGANGAIQFDLDAIGSVDDLKQQLIDKLNISETLAEAMIADAQTFSNGLKQGLNQLSLKDALSEWIAGAVEVNGEKIISQKELEAFAKDAGLDKDALKKALESEDLGVKINIVPYLNMDGSLTEEFKKTILDRVGKDGKFDLDLAYQLLLEVGLDDAAAKKELSKMAGSFEDMNLTLNGSALTKTGQVINGVAEWATEDGTFRGTLEGAVMALIDQKVAKAQELSALKQAHYTAQAVSIATQYAVGDAMQVLVDRINGIFGQMNSTKKGRKMLKELGLRTDKKNNDQYYTLEGVEVSGDTDEVDAYYGEKTKQVEEEIKGIESQLGGTGDGSDLGQQVIDILGQGGSLEDILSYINGGSQTETDEETSDPWENEYDKQYNLAQEINAELRKREKLEKDYERILNRNAATTSKLLENRRKQLASLDEERQMREKMLSKRQEEMQEIQNDYSDVGQYAWYDADLGKVQIDWDTLEKLNGSTDEELTSRVEEYISKLENQEGLIEEEQDSLDEVNDGVWEIYEQGKDTYFDLETRIKDALISERQDEIDKLSDINSSITDLNSSLLDALQKQIDDYRQMRDNERAEQDIIDQQQRLAYLQQDTSGANQLEILKLQEEIDSATEDYTDTLVDQKISELQDQNDAAAEQRQYQIDLMQAQLDNYSESQEIWQDVYNLVKTGTDASGNLLSASSLVTLLKSADGFAYMSTLGQMDWLNTLETDVSEALSWLELGATQTMLGEGKTVTFTDKSGKTLTGVVDKNGNIVTDEGVFKADTLSMDMEGNITSSMAIAPPPPPPAQPAKAPPKEEKKETKPTPGENEKRGVSAAIWNGTYGWGSGSTRRKNLAKIFGEGNNVQSQYVNKKITSGYSGSLSEYSFENMKKKYAYKTGGLADFTGPAWLDGTKSRPEYVLNATQTKAFLALVDVMESLRSSPKSSTTTENSGDNIYDIDINVESIGSNYDVEQMATAIKNLINEDAQYRNNNAISLMR